MTANTSGDTSPIPLSPVAPVTATAVATVLAVGSTAYRFALFMLWRGSGRWGGPPGSLSKPASPPASQLTAGARWPHRHSIPPTRVSGAGCPGVLSVGTCRLCLLRCAAGKLTWVRVGVPLVWDWRRLKLG